MPERGSGFARHLDPSVAELGPVGLESARRTLTEILAVFIARTIIVCRGESPTRADTERFCDARTALPAAASFVARVGAETGRDADIQSQIGLVHAIDHLARLGELIDRLDDRPQIVRHPEIEQFRSAVEEMFLLAANGFGATGWSGDPSTIESESVRIATMRRTLRHRLLEQTARGRISAEMSGEIIDTVRWLDAACYHTSRTLTYLSSRKPTDQSPDLDSSSAHRE